MFNISVILAILNIFAVNAGAQDSQAGDFNRAQPIGSIIVFRGDDVNIYSGGRKTKLEEGKMPYSLYASDEVGTSASSDCEILLGTSETIYISPDSLINLDVFGKDSTKIYLKYGIIMFKGHNPIQLQARDFSGNTTGGDFLMKYKRSTFETTVFNFGSNIKVKRDMDEDYVYLQNKSYARLSSFKKGKRSGIIKEESIPAIYNMFKISFKPEGNTAIQNNVPGINNETKSIPYTEAANLDTIKRVIGL
ncbi:MAG: hypothetical protein NTY22_01900 [Proteobacteria bacterium]|nr:hypothetical protein [Pseudomonadota bacterium]